MMSQWEAREAGKEACDGGSNAKARHTHCGLQNRRIPLISMTSDCRSADGAEWGVCVRGEEPERTQGVGSCVWENVRELAYRLERCYPVLRHVDWSTRVSEAGCCVASPNFASFFLS